jgi:hypothetical protein
MAEEAEAEVLLLSAEDVAGTVGAAVVIEPVSADSLDKTGISRE